MQLTSARIALQPRVGQASTSADGSYTYVPKAGFTGKDQFVVELKVQERSAKTDTKTVTVNVEVNPPRDDVSGCSRHSADTPPGADGIVRVRMIPGMSCDLWNNRSLSGADVTITTQPRQGSAAPSSARGIVYRANASARGSDRFDVQVVNAYTGKPRRVSVEVTFVDVL